MRPELEIVREWLMKASEDFEAARRLLQGNRPLSAVACFHCQQTVEKTLKAFLEFHGVKPPKTHALGNLFDQAATLNADFSVHRDCQWLTEFAVNPRYPGFESVPSFDHAREALADAEKLMKFVLECLPDEVHP